MRAELRVSPRTRRTGRAGTHPATGPYTPRHPSVQKSHAPLIFCHVVFWQLADSVGFSRVTRERIRQIESKTMSKLRHPSRSQVLRDYLD